MLQSANSTHGTDDSITDALPEAARPVRILIAPDKFKGCLNAIGVAGAIRSGVESAANGTRLEVTVLPLADGGDGSVEAAVFAGSRPRTVEVTGADGEMTGAQIAFDGTTAVVEVAGTCGLGTLRGALRPLSASSRGLGEAILAAARSSSRNESWWPWAGAPAPTAAPECWPPWARNSGMPAGTRWSRTAGRWTASSRWT